MISLFPSRAVALELFGFPVHWYGLLYLLAFAVAWFLLPRLQKLRGLSLSSDDWSRILSWGVGGVIVGGRLGYVLFYDLPYFVAHPLDVFAVWKGGMASHGGFIGVTLALLFALRNRRGDILKIADVVTVPVAIGLGLGRLGNFINLELYGTVTTLPWGMTFPGAEGLRHPIQIYDFIIQILIAFTCYMHLARTAVAGRTLGLFLTLYGMARFLLEFIREQHGVFVGPFSVGQILTVPVLAIGLWLFLRPIHSKGN